METEFIEHMDRLMLPDLFKKNNSGKVQLWRIGIKPSVGTVGFIIEVTHGQLKGKLQVTHDAILEGKNVGKANETTPREQALFEAEAKWTKQQERKGYKTDITKLDIDERPGAEPMLAHRYDKYPDKITLPCFLQPKLDGHRCIAVVKEGRCQLFSRQRKPITGLPHIVTAVETLAASNYKSDIVFDGELYNHDYKDNFEDLTGFIRSKEPKKGCEAVQYHIYDVVEEELSYLNRLRFLNLLFYSDYCKQVETTTIEAQEEILVHFKRHLSDGYEGAILRNMQGLYVGKRSYDLQKVKEFVDAEFEITGVEEGRGAMKGHAIFVCNTKEGKSFKAKLKGPMDDLKVIYENRDKYPGKMLTVQFQEYTKDGIPRFPVAIRVRTDA